MGKLVYFALCFLFAFIVIGQLPAAADVPNQQSQGEEVKASGRHNELTDQKKFGRNHVLRATSTFRKVLQDPEPETEPGSDGRYYCEGETIKCENDPNSIPECGNPSVCVCQKQIELCVDYRFL